MKSLRGRRARLGLFLLAVFLFTLAWAVVQPVGVSPDESMRFDIVEYLIRHCRLPHGGDPEIRNELWGISYAFNPILAYMLMALPSGIAARLVGSEYAMVLAARMVNVCFGTLSAWFVFQIGGMLFRGRARWLFTVLVTFLPQMIFVNSYVNNDAMALFAVSWILYAWTRSLSEGWRRPVLIHLALGISACALSYYNAYGYILCSVFFFCGSYLLCSRKKGRVGEMFRGGFLIAAIVAALAGWWFVRNAILYDGDILGSATSTAYAEMYAEESLKPSSRVTPQKMGMSLADMIMWVPEGWKHNWLITVLVSYVGTFGHMTVFMPYLLSKLYYLVYGLGICGALRGMRGLFHPRRLRAEKTVEKTEGGERVTLQTWLGDCWLVKNLYDWCMILAAAIPCFLLLWYSYGSDFQAQGRYVLPMTIPLMYFVTRGITAILGHLVKDEKKRERCLTALSGLYILGAMYTYCFVFAPTYR